MLESIERARRLSPQEIMDEEEWHLRRVFNSFDTKEDQETVRQTIEVQISQQKSILDGTHPDHRLQSPQEQEKASFFLERYQNLLEELFPNS